MQHATDDIVSGIMGKWAAAFSKLDAKALASLYSPHAFFFGRQSCLRFCLCYVPTALRAHAPQRSRGLARFSR